MSHLRSSFPMLLVAGAVTLVASARAFGQSAPEPVRARADLTPTTQEVPPVGSGTAGFCWDEHPCVRFGRAVVADVRATLQQDWWRSDAQFNADTEEILARDIARRRLGFSMRVFDRVDFRVEREFADDTEPWRDRYVNVRAFDVLQVRAGWFRLPFGVDATTDADRMPFALHSQSATLLAPGRDRGFMIHGSAIGHRIGYELGRFDHDGANARTGPAGRVRGGSAIAGRFSGRPWGIRSDWRGELRAGAAFTSSEIPEGLPAINARTVLDATYYSSNVFVDGHQRRIGADISWNAQPCSAAYEYMRLSNERLGESVEDSDLSPFQGEGWFVGANCSVLGDRRDVGGPRPRALLPDHRFGFVELGVRYERLRFGSRAQGDEPATSQRADVIPGNGSRIITLGMNWHINRWVRVQWNAIREALTDPASGPVPGRPHIWNRVARVQFLL